MKKIIFITAVSLFSILGTAKPDSLKGSGGIKDSTESKIDTLIAHMGFSSVTPGGVVGVIKDGRLIFKKAYGLANIETKEPNTSSTLFNLGSVSKQFTAAAILLLEKEKKLSIKDDIRKYLPDFPDYGSTITIEHLIHHTSGIRSSDGLSLMAGTLFSKDNHEDGYDVIFRQSALNYKPGDEYLYSNSGYELLVKIIEKTSGMKFSKFIEEKIFRPIGMQETFIYDNPGKISKNCAAGHQWGENPKFKRSDFLNTVPLGSTNEYTDLEDFLQWNNNFYRNKLGSWDFSKEMTAQMLLNNGNKCNYAFGLEVSDYKGFQTISHGGGTGDFSAQYLQIPSERFAVVCLFNIPCDAAGLSYKIADLFLKGNPQKDQATIQPEKVKIDSTLLQACTGKYFDDDFWFQPDISREGDHLIFDAPYQGRFEIYPLSDTSFFATVADISFIFNKNAKGEPVKLRINQGDQQFKLTYLGANVDSLNAEQLSKYAGDYYCKDIKVTYSVLFKDNKLYIRFPEATAQFINAKAESELISEHADYFASPVGGLQFSRNQKNDISGFTFKDIGRVRNLVYNKTK
jgi:CubicO group peptidase (beta-lactamase class C family)